MARPLKYNKDFHPKSFIEFSKKGKTLMQIAAEWDIARETIYDWGRKHKLFSDAIKRGREVSEAYYADLGFRAMLGQVKVDGQKANVNLGFYVWLTKNLFKWSDQVKVHQKIQDEQDPEAVKKLVKWLKNTEKK